MNSKKCLENKKGDCARCGHEEIQHINHPKGAHYCLVKICGCEEYVTAARFESFYFCEALDAHFDLTTFQGRWDAHKKIQQFYIQWDREKLRPMSQRLAMFYDSRLKSIRELSYAIELAERIQGERGDDDYKAPPEQLFL